MNRLLVLTTLILSMLVLSCQTPSTGKRGVASGTRDTPFCSQGSLKHPELNCEYPVLTTSASPLNEKGVPFIDFEKKYGLKSRDFEREFESDPVYGEQQDFAEQVTRIHVVQLLNIGVLPEEIINLIEVEKVDFANLPDVVAKVNAFREGQRRHPIIELFRRSPPKDISIQQILRGFHAKAHRCFKADFTVFDREKFDKVFDQYKKDHPELSFQGKSNEAIYESLQKGLFSKPVTYRSLVRYSNGVGADQDDREIDVRGIAFKLLATQDGEPLFDPVTKATTQDFLMTNKPNPFGENSRQFLNFAFSRAEAKLSPGNLLNFSERRDVLKKSFRDLLARHVDIQGPITKLLLKIILKREGFPATRPVSSLTTETYWSGAPYRLGQNAIKYQLVPELKATGKEVIDKGNTDYLKRELSQRMKKDDIKYTFFVQFQTDPLTTPIEDTLDPWEPSESAPIPLGELKIFKNEFDPSQDRKTPIPKEVADCQSQVFNPWHHFADHRPMSNLNRGRKAVYEASTKYRHARGVPAEPTLADIENKYGKFPPIPTPPTGL